MNGDVVHDGHGRAVGLSAVAEDAGAVGPNELAALDEEFAFGLDLIIEGLGRLHAGQTNWVRSASARASSYTLDVMNSGQVHELDPQPSIEVSDNRKSADTKDAIVAANTRPRRGRDFSPLVKG